MKEVNRQIEPFRDPILVTRPYLPPLADYRKGLEEIWNNQWLTNNGPVLKRFQTELSETLRVPVTNLSLFNNGTLALEIVFQSMGLAGSEVVTTPFTFVATSHALKRIGAVPVFADIDPETLCLSPSEAEKKITSRTKAIVPVHVYGHPCDVDGFARLGRKYGIRILYDAAHAFGVTLDGKDISAWGDASMYSFHATKLFHSIEGGLLVFRDPEVQQTVNRLRNFAILSDTECVDVGTNAKMNEMQALMGELNLRVLPELIARRKAVYGTYADAFAGRDGITLLQRPAVFGGFAVAHNYAYCPVLFRDFETRERVFTKLQEFNVFSRRYFYPLLTDFRPYMDARRTCPVAEDAARRILTLPTYHDLDLVDVRKIAEIVLNVAD